MKTTLPIMLRNQIDSRRADPLVHAMANARGQKVVATLAHHQDRMNDMSNQALRATSPTTKVRILREVLSVLHQAATPHAACKKGCSACCHQAIALSADEAAIIGREIGVKPKTPTAYASPESREATRRQWYGQPCPFLRDGACSIYASRPLACRTLYVVDADALLCTVDTADPPQALYFDPRPYDLMIGMIFAYQMERFADVRDFFPQGKR